MPEGNNSTVKCKPNDAFIIRTPLQAPRDGITALGVLIPVKWTLPDAQAALTPGSIPVVEGYALVDTGADQTCISDLAVKNLHLKCVRQGQGYGAGGLSPRHFYQAKLTFTGQMVRKPAVVQTVNFEIQAAAIPGLENALHSKTNGDKNHRMVALLGRDILSHMKFTYDGRRGDFSLEWAHDAFTQRP
jgi:hypothetical protein